jgi:hypothetical protein
MRTTRITTALLFTLVGCASIDGNHDSTRPDGGDSTDETCDSPTNKTMDVTISNGTDMKSIPAGCWNLMGTLTVNGSATSLAKLGDLRSVKNLVINGSQMTSIDTVSMLQVNGSLDIEGNAKLTSLSNIQLPQDASCLTYVDSVTIKANPALTDLGGAANMMCVSGAVVISNNVELANIKLDQAQRLEGGLEISYNDKLTGISLGNVQSITHDVIISNNNLLTSFTSLAKLKFMHGSVFIDSNPVLVTLPTEMVSPGPVVEVNLTVTNNAKLTELGAFTKLLGVNGLINITNNTTLDYCQALEVGCCVGHNGTASISTGNKNHTCATQPSCWAANGNKCLYTYTH